MPSDLVPVLLSVVPLAVQGLAGAVDLDPAAGAGNPFYLPTPSGLFGILWFTYEVDARCCAKSLSIEPVFLGTHCGCRIWGQTSGRGAVPGVHAEGGRYHENRFTLPRVRRILTTLRPLGPWTGTRAVRRTP